MQDGWKLVWIIPYVSEAFYPSLEQNFIAYRSSKVSSRLDCIIEIHQLWQSVFSWVYSNCCWSCSFKAEIIKIGQLSHKMYSNNILNSQESTTILNACIKKSANLLKAPRKTINNVLYYAFILSLWLGNYEHCSFMSGIMLDLFCNLKCNNFIYIRIIFLTSMIWFVWI